MDGRGRGRGGGARGGSFGVLVITLLLEERVLVGGVVRKDFLVSKVVQVLLGFDGMDRLQEKPKYCRG